MEVLKGLREQRRLPPDYAGRQPAGVHFQTLGPVGAYLHKVEPEFSHPGKPTDNAFIAAFNGRFRHECQNENWFLSLEDAEEKVESWRNH